MQIFTFALFSEVERSEFYAVHESTVVESIPKPISRIESSIEIKVVTASRSISGMEQLNTEKLALDFESPSNHHPEPKSFSSNDFVKEEFFSTSEDELAALMSKSSSPDILTPVFGPEPTDEDLLETINAFVDTKKEDKQDSNTPEISYHSPFFTPTPTVSLNLLEIKDKAGSAIG